MAIDIQAFKVAMSQFATGVTVLTTRHEGQNAGITANAFCSVSLDPPLVLVCVDRRLSTHDAIAQSGIFAINILSLLQMEWGDRFAGRYPAILDRFDGIEFTTAVTGSPILPGCLSWVDCTLRHAYEGGDHTIFVGEVVAVDVTGGDPPLLYHDRRWTQLAQDGPEAGSSWPEDRRRS
ncbi:MAG TPA: flavin reductase family protein [Ardenticatenaceae bacterium]|jgi:flavin reductase (DIM6/NTAB) family NADH-FMN oxidoreductase RutF